MLKFQTDDADAFADFMTPAVPGVRASALARDRFSVKTRRRDLDRSSFFIIEAENFAVRVADEAGFFGVTLPLHSAFSANTSHGSHTIEPGALHVLAPRSDFAFEMRKAGRVLVANFFEPILADFADDPLGAWALSTAAENVVLSEKSDAAQSTARFMRYLWREIEADTIAVRAPLAMREMESAAFTLFLLALEEAGRPGIGDRVGIANPAVLRRAKAFMAANLVSPLSLAEIATAAGTSIRTLTRTFRHAEGMGPIAYLRRLRLDAVRNDLLASESGSETVTAVALTYGFCSLGRFAAAYQEAFGEKPSETLRR